jgi:hypothetical protein
MPAIATVDVEIRAKLDRFDQDLQQVREHAHTLGKHIGALWTINPSLRPKY